MIRWNKSQRARLSGAIRSYNYNIKKLSGKEAYSGVILPELKSYKELKSSITSSRELNNIVNSLKRLSKENSQEIVSNDSIKYLRYFIKEAGIRQRTISRVYLQKMEAIKRSASSKSFLKAELKSLELERESLKTSKLKSITSKEGFRRKFKAIEIKGNVEYINKGYEIYKENMIKAFEETEYYDGISEILIRARKLNPKDFFEIFGPSEENSFSDIKDFYSFTQSSEAMNKFVTLTQNKLDEKGV